MSRRRRGRRRDCGNDRNEEEEGNDCWDGEEDSMDGGASSSIGCSPLTRRRRRKSLSNYADSSPYEKTNHTSPKFHNQKTAGFRFRKILDTITFSRTLKTQFSSEREADEAAEESKKCELDVVTLLLDVRLNNGEDLPVKDASGSSDPYVKFRYKEALVYKSGTIFKNLNPSWDEEFQMIVDDVTLPIRIEVFDFDRFCTDDFMGAAEIDLSQVKWCSPTEFNLNLLDEVDEPAGKISICVTISPMTQQEVLQFSQRAPKGVLTTTEKKKEKASQEWSKTVNIVLVEGRNIRIDERCPDAFCKFKLGMEKYKSKVCASSLEPKWIEQFDMHVFDTCDQILQMACIDRVTNMIVGRLTIDLSKVPLDETVQSWHDLEGSSESQILLLLTVSGTQTPSSEIEKDDFNYNDVRNLRIQKYDVFNSFADISDVGTLTVKVFCAEELQAKDFGGKSDPFAVIELVNTRVQTHTVYKTLNPNWNKIYTFSVKDIHTNLQVTVFDEDPNNRFEFLGRVLIPLISIRNCEKRWYPLKDEKLRKRVKGDILLEMDIVWNQVRATIRTFKPKERKYICQEQKFKASLFRSTVFELKDVAMSLLNFKDSIAYLLSWHSKPKSTMAFVFFVFFVYFFEIYFIPLVVLAIFGWNFVKSKSRGDDEEYEGRKGMPKSQKSEEEDEKTSNSLRDTLFSVQETLVVVQNSLLFVAQLIERIKNTFNFTNVWLSTLAAMLLGLAFVLLYFVSLRWIILVWGVNKFSKKLRNPNFVDNNEVLDFLSRVPCRVEIQEQSNKRVQRPINL